MLYPAIIDMEDSDNYKKNHGITSKEDITNICVVACNLLIEKGFKAMIYANADWYKNKLEEEKIKNYFKWVAVWNEKENPEKLKEKYIMWQYSSKGKVKGIETNVDLNFSFIDFKKLNLYVENIAKINFIKLSTGLTDLDIQFLSCYKFGQDLINKIHARLQKEKIDKKENPDYMKEVQKEYNLELKTMNYMYMYINGDFLLKALYNSICKVDNNQNIK